MYQELTFEESVFGVEKELTIKKRENCKRCDGTGAEPGGKPAKNVMVRAYLPKEMVYLQCVQHAQHVTEVVRL